MRRRSVLAMVAALVLVLVVVVAPEANGKGVTPITTCGQTVVTNAVLTTDLSCSGDGVVVGAPGIKIDLNGHVLLGDSDSLGADDGVRVAPFASVTVMNGVVRNFYRGVSAVDHVSVSKVVASGNYVGLDVVGDSASVSSSTFSGNFVYGIDIIGNNASIKSVITDGDGTAGVFVTGNGLKAKSVNASGNGNVGIHIVGDSATIGSSTAVSNYRSGIDIEGNSARVTGNQADANGFATPDFTGLGIAVVWTTLPPAGKKNLARGNDDSSECYPQQIC